MRAVLRSADANVRLRENRKHPGFRRLLRDKQISLRALSMESQQVSGKLAQNQRLGSLQEEVISRKHLDRKLRRGFLAPCFDFLWSKFGISSYFPGQRLTCNISAYAGLEGPQEFPKEFHSGTAARQ